MNFPISEKTTALFGDTSHEINDFATEDLALIWQTIFDNVEIQYNDIESDNRIYYKMTGNYGLLVEHYTNIFG